jgi:hypothetical protein
LEESRLLVPDTPDGARGSWIEDGKKNKAVMESVRDGDRGEGDMARDAFRCNSAVDKVLQLQVNISCAEGASFKIGTRLWLISDRYSGGSNVIEVPSLDGQQVFELCWPGIGPCHLPHHLRS